MPSDSLELKLAVGDATFEAVGDPDRVMSALAEFKTLVEADQRPPRKVTKVADHKDDGKTGTGSDQADTMDASKPIGVFVKRKLTQAGKATAIVYWVREREGKASLKPSEIESYWRKTPGKVPSNPPAACSGAESKGWLHNEGQGQYSITGYGEEMLRDTPYTAS